MKRMLLILLRNLWRLPWIWISLCRYAKDPDKYPRETIYALMRKIAACMIKGGRIRLEIHGKANLPEENGFILFPNHQGLFDGFAIVHGMERPFSTVYKTELDQVPFVKQVLKSVKALALERDNPRQGMQVINQVAKEVKEGRNMMIFPEGTRSRNQNQLLSFKGGSFKTAAKAKCPIVPVALINAYQVFDSKSIRPITVQLYFLAPIPYTAYAKKTTSEIAQTVRTAIAEAIEAHSETPCREGSSLS